MCQSSTPETPRRGSRSKAILSWLRSSCHIDNMYIELYHIYIYHIFVYGRVYIYNMYICIVICR